MPNRKKNDKNEIIIHKDDLQAGEEFVLRYGDARLVIKYDGERFLPDFADAMTRAIQLRPNAVAVAAQRVFHKERNSLSLLQLDIAEIRDALFAMSAGE